MQNKPFFGAIVLFALLLACGANTNSTQTEHTLAVEDPVTYGKLDTATLAAGCFWCVEAIFESLKGVKEAVSGYAGGQTKNPSYEEVCSHTTGHTETVQVFFDPKMISYQQLLEVYFASMNPTQVNGQGPDIGDSYRSVIFFHNDEQRRIAESYKRQLDASGKYDKPIAVDIQPFTVFYLAEAYHQNYERNHPENPYVQRVSIPRLNRMKAQFPQLLKASSDTH
ncbi:MAG: peptide-methionine (S)-S-oxide reductase MsrA [Saprospiraceae bacterium]|nr:peptide-methionine (S)-S-oxide reductase MsrA [Saprospiraceae bacterium]